MWTSDRIRKFTVEQLEPMLVGRPLDKMVLAQEYGATQWLVPTIGTKDVRRLGLDTTLKLAEIWESTQSDVVSTGWSMTTIPTAAATGLGMSLCNFTNRICEVFKLSLVSFDRI